MLALVNTATRAELLDALEARLARGEGFSVATLNLDHLVKLRADAAFRAAYARHSHVVADGWPVVVLRRLAGRPVDLVPGSDLVGPLMAHAARHGIPVGFLGSTEAALTRAADRLQAEYPGLKVVARISPPFGLDPNSKEAGEALQQLARSGARVCLIALGAPRQEVLAARAVESLPRCGFISVGAGLDFIAGSQRRAPLWMRRVGLEWLWRMLSDPRRLTGRYIRCAMILPGLTQAALRMRRHA
ncbi:WecB/TagA/CpsF family glycosyltransferase [Pararhodobacter sp. SW119]|uniref:WecB/TagA/CpsF family glycosyltransferase n=1 Tax=Pararhodobacter sp. SW119 TaxID=2780075 RepID=UPI001FD72803|nr:WecB/TagA/CpsF family glycosyltransferase [Pararhodobacter sp. SW119]